METATSLATTGQFLFGLGLSVLIVAASIASSRRLFDPALLLLIGACSALVLAGRAPVLLALSCGLVAAGGFVASTAASSTPNRTPNLVGALLMLIGSGVLAYATELPERPLLRVAVVVAIPLVANAITDIGSRARTATWIMVSITILGVFATIPETEDAMALVAVSPFLATMPILRRGSSITLAAAGALVVLVTWVALTGGIHRPGSVVGAMAGFGILVIEPWSRQLGSLIPFLDPLPLAKVGTRSLILAQLAVTTLSSRVVGFVEPSEPALFLAIMIAAIGWAAIALPRPRGAPSASDRVVE